MTWNTLVSFSPAQVLAASDLNNNFDNLSTLYAFVPYHAEGRLTLTTGVPVTTADVTAAATLYYTPWNGSRISLFDGSSSWTLNSFSETSLSLAGLIKGVIYDIFGYLSGGTFTLEAVAWKKVTATNSPTSGASKVINIADTTGLAVGMEVSVKDGSNSEVATITAVVAATSITVASLAASYTLPDIYGHPARATALTTQNGVYVKSGTTTKRYLGTIRITTTTGQTEDSMARRYVFNAYNRVYKKLFAKDATASWAAPTGSFTNANSSAVYGTARIGVVIGLAEDVVSIVNTTHFYKASDTISCYGPIGINSSSPASDVYFGQFNSGGIDIAPLEHYPTIGHTYYQRLELTNTSSVTSYGNGQSGVVGKVKV